MSVRITSYNVCYTKLLREISDISAITNLNVNTLDLSYNQISDLRGFEGFRFSEVVNINLEGNLITDITPLRNIQFMVPEYAHNQCLNLDNNQISDLSPIKNFLHIYVMSFNNNQISDLGPLSELQESVYFTSLSFDNNKIQDISPLRNCKRLEYLSLQNNRISDISVLADLPYLEEVNLSGTQITDWSYVSHIKIVTGIE